ncbi:MAG: peptidoglycan DD-metalloendopeptidase family protein [Parvularculaceae bacterium]|nr:peptidoglycan DD-metalloendopeptidase family protein [Parvularculaceae bacterium]
MTTLLGLNAYQSEALIACLVASVIWAGVLLLGAMHLERKGAARGDRLWIGALLLAILPSLAAPSLAAFGVSLRTGAAEAVASTDPKPHAVIERAALQAVDGAASPSSASTPSTPAITAEQAMNALAMLYVYGAALALFIWIARQAGFVLASGLAAPVENRTLLSAVDAWAFQLGVKAPQLKRSRHVSSVCLYGAVSPVILMPHDLDARIDDDDVALMCAHEIAHLKRGDTRLFTATALARVLFWFNPLVTRIANRVELAAEEGADRLVISSGVDRRAYASCFVKGLKYAAMKQSLLPALAPGFTPNDRQGRRRRLDSILSADPERRTTPGARAALAGAASIAALIAVGQAAFAVDPEAAAEKKRLAALAAAPAIEMAEPDLIKPVDGDVTLGFGKIYTSLEDNKTPMGHRGVDIKAVKGAPVKASGDGVIVEATTRIPGKENYGTTVVIDHGHGLITRYAHLDSFKVRIGQQVRKGEVIGAVGETGLVTGPHLHFETLKNGKPVDPAFASAPVAPEPPALPIWANAEPVIAAVQPVEPVAPVEPVPATAEGLADPAAPPPVADSIAFAFANGDTLTDRMVADLEHRLLGDIEAADGAAYDLEFTIDGETQRFTSGEPMTPEKRAALKAAVGKMRVHRDTMREEMEKARKEWRKTAEKMRLNAERAAEQMQQEFSLAFADREHFAASLSDDDAGAFEDAEDLREAMEQARQEAIEAEREALQSELEALEEARVDLEEAMNDGLNEAMEDLAAEADALENEDMPEVARRLALRAIEDARRTLKVSRRDHEREIERMRRETEEREAIVTQQLDALDARERTGN